MKSYLKPDPTLRNGYKDKARMKVIHLIPCSLSYFLGETQTSPTEAHHKHGGGLGLKASDLLTMSLSRNYHTSGPFAFHQIGREAFEDRFGVTQDKLIEITNELLKELD